jgi:hypothetical protein
MSKRAARIQRRDKIVLAYALALGADFYDPRPPILAARIVCEAVPDATVDEVFKIVRQAIREGNRKAAKYERAMLERGAMTVQ